ncbi:hypothetical protein T492DRAFT_870291 [Pavlovales sp. CCMP2436]|nr:hypothetical protein T492DRAFT_870291 [Pavlovales sp. CCMP2436]
MIVQHVVQGGAVSIDEYVRTFAWDDAKYPLPLHAIALASRGGETSRRLTPRPFDLSSTPMAANSHAVALFKAGEFAAAAEAFSGVISSLLDTPAVEVVAVTNRAACYSKLGETAASEADSLAPLYAKAYTRLTAALPAEHDDAAAAAAAVALSLPQPPSAELRALYDAAAAVASMRSLGLPAELSRLAIASTSTECTVALMRGAKLVVLRPGAYEYHQPMASFALVGLGSVLVNVALN